MKTNQPTSLHNDGNRSMKILCFFFRHGAKSQRWHDWPELSNAIQILKKQIKKNGDRGTGVGMKQKRCFKNWALVSRAWTRHRRDWILAEKETENIQPADNLKILLKQMKQSCWEFPPQGIALHHFWVFNLEIMQGPYSDGKRQAHNEIKKNN